MRVKAVPCRMNFDRSHYFFHAFAPPVSSFRYTSSFSGRMCEANSAVSLIPLNPCVLKASLRSQFFAKISRMSGILRCCSSNMDDVEDPISFPVEGLVGEEETRGQRNEKVHCSISKRRVHDSFLSRRIDFLEPIILGFKPEFPDWTDGETVILTIVEQKAKSCGIPLSLRMIKKKLQLEENFTDSEELAYCSVKAAFTAMAFIIVELHRHVLQWRGALECQDLEIIASNVQKEMHLSFVWLFQQVFSRSPTLMLHLIIFLANFSEYSASASPSGAFTESPAQLLCTKEEQIQPYAQTDSSLVLESSSAGGNLGEEIEMGDAIRNSEEMNLWKSMMADARKMQEGKVSDDDAGHTLQHFVSPVSVELEPDCYENYLRTDLLYQMNLSQEPNNPLLLCNYGKFLQLVARDHDRAEECFKRAIQVSPPDAEARCQYAEFLWRVKMELTEAEEMFLQALAIEPDSWYYSSRYANFLWSTGGEDTCFPLSSYE